MQPSSCSSGGALATTLDVRRRKAAASSASSAADPRSSSPSRAAARAQKRGSDVSVGAVSSAAASASSAAAAACSAVGPRTSVSSSSGALDAALGAVLGAAVLGGVCSSVVSRSRAISRSSLLPEPHSAPRCAGKHCCSCCSHASGVGVRYDGGSSSCAPSRLSSASAAARPRPVAAAAVCSSVAMRSSSSARSGALIWWNCASSELRHRWRAASTPSRAPSTAEVAPPSVAPPLLLLLMRCADGCWLTAFTSAPICVACSAWAWLHAAAKLSLGVACSTLARLHAAAKLSLGTNPVSSPSPLPAPVSSVHSVLAACCARFPSATEAAGDVLSPAAPSVAGRAAGSLHCGRLMTLEASRSASRSAVAATGTTPPELAVAGRDVRGRASSSAVPVRRSRAARMAKNVTREWAAVKFRFPVRLPDLSDEQHCRRPRSHRRRLGNATL